MKKENSALIKAESLTASGKDGKNDIKEENRRTDEELKEIKTEMENREHKHGAGKVKRLRVAVGVLAVSVIALSGGLLYKMFGVTESDNMLNASYDRSFYDAVEQVGSIDLNLSKALATEDPSALSGYLLDAAIESELAESDIHDLPIKDENKEYTTKLINQIGDFSKTLNKKIARGEKITEEDYEILGTLYKYNRNLKDALNGFIKNRGEGYKFDIDADREDAFISGLNQLENLSVEYPELIYDGPFSDGLVKREIKGMSGDAVSAERAEEIFKNLFNDYEPQEIEVNKSVNGQIPAFNVSAKIKDKNVLAEISEMGGQLLFYSAEGSCNAKNYALYGIEEIAERFIENAGAKNMKPVWYAFYNNAYTINYAAEENGAVIYPDMIKIKLCAETGDVIGYEATTYYKNHTERKVGAPELTETQAKKSVSKKLVINSARLAVIPFGESSERLCYEFVGEKDGETYYVYIDAVTGSQIQMFKVIESTEGTLLM